VSCCSLYLNHGKFVYCWFINIIYINVAKYLIIQNHINLVNYASSKIFVFYCIYQITNLYQINFSMKFLKKYANGLSFEL